MSYVYGIAVQFITFTAVFVKNSGWRRPVLRSQGTAGRWQFASPCRFKTDRGDFLPIIYKNKIIRSGGIDTIIWW